MLHPDFNLKLFEPNSLAGAVFVEDR